MAASVRLPDATVHWLQTCTCTFLPLVDSDHQGASSPAAASSMLRSRLGICLRLFLGAGKMIFSAARWWGFQKGPIILLMLAAGSFLLLVVPSIKRLHFLETPDVFDPNTIPPYLRHSLINALALSESFPQRDKSNGAWYSLRLPQEIYLYSAFYDDRHSLGVLPNIRIISVAENLEGTNLYCTADFGNVTREFRAAVEPLAIGSGIIRHNKLFKEYILSCPLLNEHIPKRIAIIANIGDSPTLYLPVEAPVRVPYKENFAVCVSVSYWRQNPRQIVEWLELLRILGVSLVTVYNNSLDAASARVFKHYDQEGFVDFRQSHSFISDPGELTIHMHMSPVINDCMYRNMHRFKKLVVTDLDEIIIPQFHLDYSSLLVDIDQRFPSIHAARNYIFQNAYFFSDFPEMVDEPNLITLRHRMRLPPSGRGYSVKSIIDPQACTNMHNHFCWGHTKLYEDVEGMIEVPPDMALNQHYKRCHFDEFENQPGKCAQLLKEGVRDDTMLRFKDKLVKSVSQQFRSLGMDPL